MKNNLIVFRLIANNEQLITDLFSWIPYNFRYDTLGFQGKKITIIPLLKDEGKKITTNDTNTTNFTNKEL